MKSQYPHETEHSSYLVWFLFQYKNSMLKNSAAAQLNSARTERRGVCQRIAEAKVLSRVHVEWRLEVGPTVLLTVAGYLQVPPLVDFCQTS